MATYHTGETPDEIWYPIPGFPGYEFSSDQRVRSFRKMGNRERISEDAWRILTPQVNAGYPAYKLSKNGKYRTLRVHRIVAMLAYGEIPDGVQVLHGDDDETNNYASNLTLGTQADNSKDAIRNKKTPSGSVNGHSKFSDNDVREMRRLAAEGVPQKDIAEKFGASRPSVSMIVSRKTWKNVA